MKKTYFKPLIFCLLLIVGFASVSAQESTTLQFMKGMPQSDLQNPALHNDSSAVVIGFPGLSGMYGDVNSGFAVNDLKLIDRFYDSLKPTNSIEQHFSMPLFSLGIRSKKSFFSFGITEKQVTQFTFAKSLVQFIKDGNAPYIGQNFDLGDMDMDAIHYREFAFGYSNELIKNKLTVGVKAKVLYGKSAIQTEKMNLKVETAADVSYLNLSSDMKINMSAPITAEFDSVGYFSGMNGDNIEPVDYVLQKGNKGMAFDLGAVYKLTPKITLSGSIVDIGKISFKKDVITLEHVSNYKWEGIDISKSIDNTKSDYVSLADLFENEVDKMKDSFRPHKSEFGSEAFDMSLPTKIYLGGTYEVNNKINIGILDRLYKNGDFSQNTVTLSANTMLRNFLSLTGSYSMIGNSYNNLGLGMSIRMGFMQIYFVGDNVLAIADPAKVDYANLRFGMNFLLGRQHKPKVAEASDI